MEHTIALSFCKTNQKLYSEKSWVNSSALKAGFIIKEFPTVWEDQADSKLTLKGGTRMLGALFKVWWQHLWSKK